jgi:flagellar biosynthesis/type III secretory pathway M-ring protein FliF/YscJ
VWRPASAREALAALLESRKVDTVTPDTAKTVLPAIFIGLVACWLVFAIIMIWRGRRQNRRWREQTRRWQHESRVHQRVQERLAQEYENLLTPEERQRREAQRQHLQELRAQAEAELATEASRRGRT